MLAPSISLTASITALSLVLPSLLKLSLTLEFVMLWAFWGFLSSSSQMLGGSYFSTIIIFLLISVAESLLALSILTISATTSGTDQSPIWAKYEK